MKVGKPQILDVLESRVDSATVGQVDALLPPEVDLDAAHHRSELERLGVDVDELRGALGGRT